jgi:2-aminoadipate transaminase
MPGFRLGWAAAPAEVAGQLVSAKQNTDQCSGGLGQRMLEEYIRRGWIEEQLPLSRELYKRKCRRLLGALERTMPDGASWTHAEGGFFSWLTVPGSDTTALAASAADAGVGIVPGALFYPDGRGGDSIRLSFSQVDESLIDEGVERLAALVA